ncbi:hypothetical protein MT325_m524R [Paramecium bursaria chlorella virus MT325]|uniref:Uncharacterized protein m524R n=1 Tax=Paramecium bursaria Chlorella virus MT325 TaxID=346932 RepID=A7IUQ4_PBCVM|nr:hypothetical protein MT325_m524R [Paramecium bursaria chlorella virus MT325]
MLKTSYCNCIFYTQFSDELFIARRVLESNSATVCDFIIHLFPWTLSHCLHSRQRLCKTSWFLREICTFCGLLMRTSL